LTRASNQDRPGERCTAMHDAVANGLDSPEALHRRRDRWLVGPTARCGKVKGAFTPIGGLTSWFPWAVRPGPNTRKSSGYVPTAEGGHPTGNW
jgi:hypothetical protein